MLRGVGASPALFGAHEPWNICSRVLPGWANLDPSTIGGSVAGVSCFDPPGARQNVPLCGIPYNDPTIPRY